MKRRNLILAALAALFPRRKPNVDQVIDELTAEGYEIREIDRKPKNGARYIIKAVKK